MNWKVMEDQAMMGPVVVPRGNDSKAVRDKAILPEAVGKPVGIETKKSAFVRGVSLSQFPKLWLLQNQDGCQSERSSEA